MVKRAAPRFRETKLQPLVGQIATFLQGEVMLGRYKPGERVREQEIADHLGVSRGPVREALRVLENRGLVEIMPWRGARVTALSAHDLNELYQTRGALLALMVKLAAANATDDEIVAFGRAVEDLNRMAHRKNVTTQEFLTGRYTATEIVLKASRNRTAHKMFRQLVQRTQGYYTASSAENSELRMELVALYRRMHEALTHRQAAAAEEVASKMTDLVRASALTVVGHESPQTPEPRARAGKSRARRKRRSA